MFIAYIKWQKYFIGIREKKLNAFNVYKVFFLNDWYVSFVIEIKIPYCFERIKNSVNGDKYLKKTKYTIAAVILYILC